MQMLRPTLVQSLQGAPVSIGGPIPGIPAAAGGVPGMPPGAVPGAVQVAGLPPGMPQIQGW